MNEKPMTPGQALGWEVMNDGSWRSDLIQSIYFKIYRDTICEEQRYVLQICVVGRILFHDESHPSLEEAQQDCERLIDHIEMIVQAARSTDPVRKHIELLLNFADSYDGEMPFMLLRSLCNNIRALLADADLKEVKGEDCSNCGYWVYGEICIHCGRAVKPLSEKCPDCGGLRFVGTADPQDTEPCPTCSPTGEKP